MTNHKPARAKLPVLTQLCKLIPSHLTASLAKKHGIDKQARTFSAWSHVVSLLFALHRRGVQWVTRAKDNMAYTVRKKLLASPPEKSCATTSSFSRARKAAVGHRGLLQAVEANLQVCDFLGHSREAIRWQLWAELLLYVLMRWQGQAAGWAHSFSRLLAMTRGVVWDRIDLAALLRSHGTAGGGWRMRSCCEGTYLPGFSP